MSNAVAEILWLQYLLQELRIPSSCVPLVYCDNLSAVYLAANPVLHARTKHVEIDHHFVRDKVVASQFQVEHVPATEQLADPLTKPIAFRQFLDVRPKLTILPCPQSI